MRRLGGGLVAAVVLAGLVPGAARAATAGDLQQLADRAAAVWAQRQDAQGFFLDPRTDDPVPGYGNAMLGYALLRAGARAGDRGMVRSGVRGIATTLDEPPPVRGVFDLLAVASAYNAGRERLVDDPEWAAAEPRWAAYLRATTAPNIDNEVRECILAPGCFHNHEAVAAAADLELLATGLDATGYGALLADPAALRAQAVEEVEAQARFARGDATWTGAQGSEGDLALLSDTGNQPLAYHALSTAMLARSVDRLGEAAPEPARAALRRTVGALAGLMAPDGAVAYIGKRQEDLWSLAATLAAAEIAIRRADPGPDAAARFRAVADRALARIRARYPLTGRGLPIVPRSGPRAFAPDGVDGDPMTFNGLALFLLNVAADAAPAEQQGEAARLRSDADGVFLDRTQNGFAAVRRGDVWFAVHGRRASRDVRNDFGLVAAKWRTPSGGWLDLLRPRPMRFEAGESAGPVIEREGRRLVPQHGAISLGPAGEVSVRAMLGGAPTSFRFIPTGRGVRIALRARAGDVVTYTAYLPEGAARVAGDTVADRDAVVRAAPAPASIRLVPGFSSCCDPRMVAARVRVPMAADGTVSFTIAARAGAASAAPRQAPEGAGARTVWILVAVLALAAAAGAVVLRRRAVRRAQGRRRRRPPRRQR